MAVGVLGMMRMTGSSVPASCSNFAISMPAAMVMSSGLRFPRTFCSGESASCTIWGFTAIKIRSHRAAMVSASE